MINREFQKVEVRKFLSSRDEYGQPRLLYKILFEDEMFIKFFSSALANNPGYEDIDFIALTKRRDIDSTCVIHFNGKNYRILNVIPSRKFNQLFIRETNENPEEAQLDTPTGLYEIGEEFTFNLGCEPPVEKALYYSYEILNLTTGQSVTYKNRLNPILFTPTVDSFPTGDYKFRMKALHSPEYSDFKDSEWSEWFEFHLVSKLLTPTMLDFDETETEYQFRWFLQGSGFLFTTEIWKGDTRVGSYPGTTSNLWIPKAILTFEPGDDYKFRVMASKEGYSDSDWSEWCDFIIYDTLDTPTATRFVELSTSYQFHFTEVENAYMYDIQVTKSTGVEIGTYSSVNSPFTLLLSIQHLLAGNYKFRVRARGSGYYMDSDWSDWKDFRVIL